MVFGVLEPRTIKQGEKRKRQKDKWYPFHACTTPPPPNQITRIPFENPPLTCSRTCDCGGHLMGNRPGAKIRKNGKENGKWPPPDMAEKTASEMEEMAKKMAKTPFLGFGAQFSAISGQGPFYVLFPFFLPGFVRRAEIPFCRWPPHSQGPSRTKNTTESDFRYGGVNSVRDVAKRYGEAQKCLLFPRKKRQENGVWILKKLRRVAN